jgi:hypothetical protein
MRDTAQINEAQRSSPTGHGPQLRAKVRDFIYQL